jgi:phosphate-selective porin OprO/OprP
MSVGGAPTDSFLPSDTTDVQVEVGPEGVRLASSDGAYALDLGGDVQVDGRFPLRRAPRARPGTFALRRARLKVGALFAGRHRIRVTADFDENGATPEDVYIETRLADHLAVRAGQFKAPVGLEFLQSSSDLRIAERGLPSQLVPQRDVGAVLNGRFFDGSLRVQAGILNGTPDGEDGLDDLDAGKDGVMRVFIDPIQSPNLGVGLGIAATYGRRGGEAEAPQLPEYETVAGQEVFQYGTGRRASVWASGTAFRLAPQLYAHAGPVSVLAEVTRSAQTVAAPASAEELEEKRREETVAHRAWQVAAAVVLTGESAAFDRVRPEQPLDPSGGRWGAVEVAGRVQQMHVDDAVFPAFADSQTQAGQIRAYGGSVNWYLDANVRVMMSYFVSTTERTDGSDLLPTEHFLVTRFQVAF